MEEKRVIEIHFRDDNTLAIFYPTVFMDKRGFYTASYEFIPYNDMDKVLTKIKDNNNIQIYNSVFTFQEPTKEYLDKIIKQYVDTLNTIIDLQKDVKINFENQIDDYIKSIQNKIRSLKQKEVVKI